MQAFFHKNAPLNSKITLVGAGPGDPDLITLKGLRAIQQADVILYDALVNEALLKEARKDAHIEFVGKRAGATRTPQAKINDLLVKYALKKGQVVRLKGGDPFVFGRGFEELNYVSRYGIQVEVIPGISSCIAVAGLQHVPITSRGVNESFWVVTGTTRSGALSADIQLAAKSSAAIVVLMGIRKIAQIAQLFCRENKADTPCMVVQKGSWQDEKFVLATMADIADKVQEQGIGSPGIIYIGNIVKLHQAWPKAEASNLIESLQNESINASESTIPHFSKTA
ncbi:MAG: uroporphyrinogen-III C-methyltransferase [Bacteroidota bacterium]